MFFDLKHGQNYRVKNKHKKQYVTDSENVYA